MLKRIVLRLLVVVFVGISLLGGGQVAAEGSSTISGVVLDGRPDSGAGCSPVVHHLAWVNLWVPGGEGSYSDFIQGLNGTFTFFDVPNGMYTLQAGIGLSGESYYYSLTVSDADISGITLIVGNPIRGELFFHPDCGDLGTGGDGGTGGDDGTGGEIGNSGAPANGGNVGASGTAIAGAGNTSGVTTLPGTGTGFASTATWQTMIEYALLALGALMMAALGLLIRQERVK